MLKKLKSMSLFDLAENAVLSTCIGAIAVVYVFDMIFFGSIASDPLMVPVFVLLGLVFRTAAVAFGVYLQAFAGSAENHLARGILRALWVTCISVCLLSALHFFAAGDESKKAEGTTGVAITQTNIASARARQDRLQAEIAAARSDKDAALAQISESIAMLDDPVAGMSQADNQTLQTLQAAAETARNNFDTTRMEKEALIDAIDQQLTAYQADQTVGEHAATTWAVFKWVSDRSPIGDEAAWTDSGLFYIAMIIEALAALGLGAYAALRPMFRRRRIEESIAAEMREIENRGALAAARIRAQALETKLAREAEREVYDQVRSDPEFKVAQAAIAAMRRLYRHIEETAADDEPDDEAEEPDQSPPPPPPPRSQHSLNGSKGGEATSHNREAQTRARIKIPPKLSTDEVAT